MGVAARIGKEPVSEASPAGRDVRYDACFESLQAEIDKLSSPTSRESFSWETVATLSSGILADDSKDLLVASYLCVALVNLEGWGGLAIASEIYSDLLRTYWDHLYPPVRRMGGRLSAVQWWMEKTEEALSGEMQGTLDGEALRRIHGKLGQIDRFLQENTAFDLSLASLAAKIQRVIPANGSHEETAKPSTERKTEESVAVQSEEVVPDAGNLMRSMAPLFKNLKLASKMVREEAKHNPQSYRWLRFAVWEPVKSMPPAVDGVTKIPPPPRQAVAHLITLMDDEAWEELLSQSESQLYNPQNTFLFSLNYYSAEALSHLGKKYRRAHETVCRETRLMFQRLPGIEDLRFSDGTPFACGETLEWAARMTQPLEGQGGTVEDVAEERASDEVSVTDVIKSARSLARQDGKLHDAVDGLHRKIRESLSGKEALRLRLGLISLLAEHRHEKTAAAHLERAHGDIIRFDLSRWDPPLALGGLKVIYNVMRRLPGKEPAERAAEVLAMIAEINTVEAMKLQRKS